MSEPIETTATEAAAPAPTVVDLPDGSQAMLMIAADGTKSLIPIPTPAAPAPEPVAAAPAPAVATPPAPAAPITPEPVAAAPAAPTPAVVTPTPAASSVPAVVTPPPAAARNDGSGIEGLDDVDASDMTMPMIKIVHDEALWEDSLSGEKFPELDVVLLGLIKQRILWPSEVADGDSDGPLCRSYNFTLGHPGSDFTKKDNKVTPLEVSGFTQADLDAGPLSCTSCNLKEWGSHPLRDVPWCVEQFVFAVMLGEPDEPMGAPAIMTLQRSSMKPAKAYLTSFLRARSPLFTARTTLKLNGQSRGSVKYSVPKFIKGVPTDPDYHGEYASLYRAVKDFVSTPRSAADEETPVTVSAAAPVVAPTVNDDDLPF